MFSVHIVSTFFCLPLGLCLGEGGGGGGVGPWPSASLKNWTFFCLIRGLPPPPPSFPQLQACLTMIIQIITYKSPLYYVSALIQD